jgi:hypothetical protein
MRSPWHQQIQGVKPFVGVKEDTCHCSETKNVFNTNLLLEQGLENMSTHNCILQSRPQRLQFETSASRVWTSMMDNALRLNQVRTLRNDMKQCSSECLLQDSFGHRTKSMWNSVGYVCSHANAPRDLPFL